ncbi:MAG: hypothetical protein AAGE94_20950 [Acidobacteriota bacterium]
MVQRWNRARWWIGCGLVIGLAVAPAAGADEWWAKPRPESASATVVPTAGTGPEKNDAVSFVLDGDGYDGDFGFFRDGDLNTPSQALYLNRFTPDQFPLILDEVQIFFTCNQFDGTSDGGDCIGKAIDLVVIEDSDGDGSPQTGAQAIAVRSEIVQTIDKVNFSTYRLEPALRLDGPGDFFVGFIPRWIETGVTGFTVPTTMENVVPHPGRSWGLAWSGDPPVGVILPADETAVTTDEAGFLSTFKIRASGFHPDESQCVASPRTLCLGANRFAARVQYRVGDTTGSGSAVALNSFGLNAGGIFYFFDPTNPEMLIKMLDGCDRSIPRFWVFFAATTDVEFELTVTDTWTDEQRVYTNPAGQRADAVTDTDAFATCDAVPGDPVRFGYDEE